jgi:hypothetical protein
MRGESKERPDSSVTALNNRRISSDLIESAVELGVSAAAWIEPAGSAVGDGLWVNRRQAFMNDPEDITERLTRQLDRVAALREAAVNDSKLDAARQRLRAWQAVRLARTHAELLANPRMGLAASFFLTDIYGAEDLSKLDANVQRVVPTMKRVLPAAGLEIVADAIELEALSEDLDFATATALGAEANNLSAATYGAAYRKVDRRAERERQIDLIENLGQSLDRLVHKPLVGTTLSLMRKPAQLAGLAELQDFLHRGYKAFIKMGDVHEFLDLVVGRERKLLEALFDGDDSLLGV